MPFLNLNPLKTLKISDQDNAIDTARVLIPTAVSERSQELDFEKLQILVIDTLVSEFLNLLNSVRTEKQIVGLFASLE